MSDLSFAFRLFRRNPWYSAAVAGALAAGISASTILFSVFNSLVWRLIPYDEPHRLFIVSERDPRGGYHPVAPASYVELRRQSKTLDVAIRQATRVGVAGQGEPRLALGAEVSAGYFSVAQLRPLAGRFFSEAEDRIGQPCVVVAAAGLWKAHLNSMPMGSDVRIDQQHCTLIGVLPDRSQLFGEQLWLPIKTNESERVARHLTVLARLKPGATPEAARRELDTIHAGLAAEYPAIHQGWRMVAEGLYEWLEDPEVRHSVAVLLAGAGFLLLIACGNIASLQLARASARETEMAVRKALGAPPGRLFRQVLAENLMLAVAGGLAGLALAAIGIRLLPAVIPADLMPPSATLSLDIRVAGFAAAVSAATVLLFGAAQGWHLASSGAQEQLRASRGSSQGRTTARIQRTLAALQIAQAFALTCGALLMAESLAWLDRIPLGFNTNNLLTVRVILPKVRYSDPAKAAAFYRNAIQAIRELPGVTSVSTVTMAPLRGSGFQMPFDISGDPSQLESQRPEAHYQIAHPEYFRTLRTMPLQGREFEASDTFNRPRVLLVNEAFARKYLNGRDPLRTSLRTHYVLPGETRLQAPEWHQIVGVVPDIKMFPDRTLETPPVIYAAAEQSIWWHASFLVRADRNPETLIPAVQSRILSVDRDVVLTSAGTMESVWRNTASAHRVRSQTATAFAGLALGLAAFGVFSMVSYDVSRRRREIGIRMALGAAVSDIGRLILVRASVIAALGLSAGLLLLWPLNRLLGSLFAGIPAGRIDFPIAAAPVLTAVTLCAAWFPTRQTARIDPVEVLREE